MAYVPGEQGHTQAPPENVAPGVEQSHEVLPLALTEPEGQLRHSALLSPEPALYVPSAQSTHELLERYNPGPHAAQAWLPNRTTTAMIGRSIGAACLVDCRAQTANESGSAAKRWQQIETERPSPGAEDDLLHSVKQIGIDLRRSKGWNGRGAPRASTV
jgi:hypothetical protein